MFYCTSHPNIGHFRNLLGETIPPKKVSKNCTFVAMARLNSNLVENGAHNEQNKGKKDQNVVLPFMKIPLVSPSLNQKEQNVQV